ncbi:MAG TPA: alpha/beta fold hydrolase, partial [Balneolaceae bacterium]|nr:alpha/beta fold hydrolase [Balneolaceae bacterium]
MSDKQHLIILHGALGDKTDFGKLIPILKHHFKLHALDFEGHGENGSINGPFQMEHFAENVLNYLDENKIKQANIFGYSMGG